MFRREAVVHILLVLSWQYVTVHEALTFDSLFAESTAEQGVLWLTICAATAFFVEELAWRIPPHQNMIRLLLGAPGMIAAILRAEVLADHRAAATAALAEYAGSTIGDDLPVALGDDWLAVLAMATLTTLTVRNVLNELYQLRHLVPTVEEFDIDFPDEKREKEKKRN